jgi:hypothetical protein
MGDLALLPVWCSWHRAHEPRTRRTFRVCMECGHVYETAADLEREFAVLGTEIHPAVLVRRRVELVTFCPLCLHDW